MERHEAITKIRALRNPNGRTPEEAAALLAGAERLMAKFGITESDLNPTPYDWFQPVRPSDYADTIRRSQEAADRARAAAQAVKFAEELRKAREAAAQAKAKPATKKAPNRGTFQDSVPFGRVHPDRWASLMSELGLRTKGDLAKACGVSSSLVSEWFGKGRGHFATDRDFEFYSTKARKAA